jgi:hypothetical protein
MADEELIRKMKEALRKEIEKAFAFWETTYPGLSFDEKVGFWTGETHRQMRWQAESGLDPYAIFTPSSYEWMKEKEPSIDEIMDKAFADFLAWEWNKEEYLKRIGRV